MLELRKGIHAILREFWSCKKVMLLENWVTLNLL